MMTLAALALILLAAPASAVPAARAPVVFQGMCDASGAVVLDDARFIVADDEDNILRVYDGTRGGAPLAAFDVSRALELPVKKKGAPEADLEAATRLGEQALWLASHGRNGKGKVDSSRMRFFATTLPVGNQPARMVGRPYKQLLDDLVTAPSLADLGLHRAAQRAPKEPGGLNLEGMTARSDGQSVLLGFRSPLVGGKALLVPLLNPMALVAGERARFGDRVLLDLDGLGVRSLSFWRGRYLVVAGAVDSSPAARLYIWDGASPRAARVPKVDLAGFNPEGVAAFPAQGRVLLLSDDGTRELYGDGQPCKKLDDPAKKQFRGLWVTID
jgi:hypothetical protein